MAMPVVTVASGGLPVVDVTATTGSGTPVSEATNLRGTAVTKVVSSGMSVVYSTVADFPNQPGSWPDASNTGPWRHGVDALHWADEHHGGGHDHREQDYHRPADHLRRERHSPQLRHQC